MGDPVTLLAAMEPTRAQLAQRARRQRESGGSVKDVNAAPTSASRLENNVHRSDGLIEHLGENLPDANGYASADEQQNADHQLLAEHSAVPASSAAQPQKEGKLKRTNHIGPAAAGFQRRMGKTMKARPDQYDFLGDSPQKPRHAPSGLLGGPLQPTPLKKQRKPQQTTRAHTTARPTTPTGTADSLRVSAATSATAKTGTTPRRSPRKSKDSERGQSPKVVVEQTREAKEGWRRDLERDHADDSRHSHPDDDELAQSHGSMAQSSEQKRRRGRPRKHREGVATSIEARESDVEQYEVERSKPRPVEQLSSGKKPRGRPPKQKSKAVDSTEEDEVPAPSQEDEQTASRADEGFFVSEAEPEEDEENAEELPPPQISKVRASDMFGTGAPDINLVDDTEFHVQPAQQTQKQKRVPEQANTSKRQQKKPRLTSQMDVPETIDISLGQLEANDDDDNDQRLLGQWQALNRVFRNVQKVGVSVKDGEEQRPVRLDLKHDDVIEIKRLCSRAKDVLLQLRDEPELRDGLSDPPEELDEIKHRIRGLCGKNGDYPTNFDSRRKPLDIYFHLIPRILVKLLRTMIQVYYDLDKQTGDAESDMSEIHLDTITKFIGIILEMGAGAESYTVRPDADLAIIKPVKSGLIVPLRNIRTVFSAHLQDLAQARRSAQRRREAQQERDRQERREEAEKRHKAERARLHKKWMSLHDQRRFVERGLISREKQKHLRFPDPAEAEPEYDSIGRSFQRQPVFTTRIGPLPAAAEKARTMVWPAKALEALQLGLKRYAGPLVYEKIFAEHCCDARGVLNAYNVTEIVVVASEFKKYLEQDDMEKLGFVQDWVEAIPVWPKEYRYVEEEDERDDENIENVAAADE